LFLNRSDIADKAIIIKTAKKHKIKILAEIPYSKQIEKDYSAGRPIGHPAIQKIIGILK